MAMIDERDIVLSCGMYWPKHTLIQIEIFRAEGYDKLCVWMPDP